jgi:hypothetical protein
MKITVTAREILNSNLVGGWSKFCDKYGINPYAVKEGLMSDMEEFEISLEDAKDFGLMEDNNEG